MKFKQNIIIFTLVLIFSMIVVLNTWTQETLSKDEKRFDLDRNGELGTSEKELMVRVVRTENARGIQFSEDEIRQMQNGRPGQSRGGGGSREPSGPRLNPEQVEFKDGTATIPDRETFKKLSYQGTEVRIDTQLAGIEFVKIQVENTHTQNPQLYFMNTKTHRSHGSFMRAAGLGRGQGQMRGVLSYRPLFTAPNGEPGVYTFEFNPNDAFPFEKIRSCARHASSGNAVTQMCTAQQLLIHLWGAIEIGITVKRHYMTRLNSKYYFQDDLYSNVGYLPLTSGTYRPW